MPRITLLAALAVTALASPSRGEDPDRERRVKVALALSAFDVKPVKASRLDWFVGDREAVAAPRPAVVWRTDYEAALAEARRADKPLLVFFTRGGCLDCERQKLVWASPKVADALSTAVTVQVSSEARPDLVGALGITLLPAVVVGRPDGRLAFREQGLQPPDVIVKAVGVATPK